MVSAVQTSVALNSPTTTTHVLKLRSPAAQSATPVASSSSRLAGPIKLTGEFEKRGIKHYDVTPAIGTEFPDGAIDLGEILSRDDEENEALLRELASLGESAVSIPTTLGCTSSFHHAQPIWQAMYSSGVHT